MNAPGYASRSDEAQVAELAAELLEIGDEQELEEFLGSLASSVIKGAKSFVNSGVGKALGGALKGIAKTALPALGGALGSMVMPGVGTAIGAKLGSMAGGLLEVGELEALGEAEAEYRAAERYVRFARDAYANAARAPRGAPPRAVARAATVAAAKRHAPGLLRDRGDGGGRRPGAPRSARGSSGAYGSSGSSGSSGTSGSAQGSSGGYRGDDRWRRRRRTPEWSPGPYPTYAWGPPWAVGAGWDGAPADGPGSDPGYDAGPPPPDGDAVWTPDADQEAPAGGPQGTGQYAAGAGAAQGRWVRKGRRIVVLGA